MVRNKSKIQVLKSGQFVLTVPKAIAEMKRWEKGTEIEFVENRYGELVIREVVK